jgi:hypothetical protein
MSTIREARDEDKQPFYFQQQINNFRIWADWHPSCNVYLGRSSPAILGYLFFDIRAIRRDEAQLPFFFITLLTTVAFSLADRAASTPRRESTIHGSRNKA